MVIQCIIHLQKYFIVASPRREHRELNNHRPFKGPTEDHHLMQKQMVLNAQIHRSDQFDTVWESYWIFESLKCFLMTFEDPQSVCVFFRWWQVLMTWKRFTTARHLMDLKPSNFLLTKAEAVHRIFTHYFAAWPQKRSTSNYSRLEDWKMQTLAMGYNHSVSINK